MYEIHGKTLNPRTLIDELHVHTEGELDTCTTCRSDSSECECFVRSYR